MSLFCARRLSVWSVAGLAVVLLAASSATASNPQPKPLRIPHDVKPYQARQLWQEWWLLRRYRSPVRWPITTPAAPRSGTAKKR